MTALAVTDLVGDLIEAFGEPALALLLIGETLFPPVPSEVVLPLAGFYIDQGRISFAGALAGATAGSLIGAGILYGVGRYGGRPLILARRRFLRVREQDLERAERWFERFGPAMVLVGRVIPLVRSVISIPAGTMRMRPTPFVLLTVAGSAVWNAALLGAGWALGSQWQEVSDVVDGASPFVLGALALAALALGASWWRRRRGLARTGARD